MKSQQNQWELVAEQLIRDIRRGTYKSGEKVPSENEMAGRFGVPRSDIRKAYSCLKELGYLRSSRGCGSFVAPQNPALLHEQHLKKVEDCLQGAVDAARLGGIRYEEVAETLRLLWEG